MPTDPLPASAGDVLGAAGTPLTLTYRGQAHPASPATLAVVDRVEKLVAARQTAAVSELEGVLSPAELADLRRDLRAGLKAREHATGGSMWASEMGADGGTRGLMLILFACLEQARETAKDPKSLPPPISFEDMTTVLFESPDAAEVAALLMPDFFLRVGERKKLPPATVQKLVADYQEAVEKAKRSAV